MTKTQGCRSRHEGFACTRKQSHKGRHEARGINGVKLATWATKASKAAR
jgi:hypothetical protein